MADLDNWLVPVVSIFFVVDPLAAVPAFLTMTAGDPPPGRRAMALKASIFSTIILVVFAIAGGLIFKFFGLTIPAFRIAGGERHLSGLAMIVSQNDAKTLAELQLLVMHGILAAAEYALYRVNELFSSPFG